MTLKGRSHHTYRAITVTPCMDKPIVWTALWCDVKAL